ncbi:MAG: DinB family protein [Chitinophagaceae bacterium]|nr:DinB family protein [Chitinophagaceae bacterium]
MQSIANNLEAIVEQHHAALQSIPESEMSDKPSPTRWSKKEILGHLVDSAQNNIRRFIVAQYEENPYIVYNQDKWVEISNYQRYDTTEILQLWRALNRQIVTILRNMPPDMAERNCHTQQDATIGWLADDYVKHLRHHLHQVLDLEEVIYP